jgi:hypothetical protein
LLLLPPPSLVLWWRCWWWPKPPVMVCFSDFSTSGLWTTAECTDIVTTSSLLYFEKCGAILLVEVYCSFRGTYCCHLQGQRVSHASRVFTPADTAFRERQPGPYYIFSDWEYSIWVTVAFISILIKTWNFLVKK